MRRVRLLLLFVLAGGGCASSPDEEHTVGPTVPEEEHTVESRMREVENRLRRQQEQRVHSLRTGDPNPGPAPVFASVDVAAIRESIRDMPGWHVHRSPHFAVVHNCEFADAITLARVAEEATRGMWREQPRQGEIHPPLIRCVHSRELFHSYGGSADSLGFWSSAHNELVVVLDDEGAEATAVTLRKLLRIWYARTSTDSLRRIVRVRDAWHARRAAGTARGQ